MTPELVKVAAAAADNQWGAIFPELMLACLALALLALEIVLPKKLHAYIPHVALAGGRHARRPGRELSATLGKETFNGLLLHSPGGQVMRAFLPPFGDARVRPRPRLARETQGPARRVLPPRAHHHGAMMLLAQSNHFVMFFVALETVTIGFYILVSYFRRTTPPSRPA
jgi:NADH-quinone oxidoreductase subunit N